MVEAPILEAALDYCRRGWRVVPINPGRKNPWNRPPGYQERPAPTEAEIRSWFDKEPNLNIGILTGRGIIVIDVDEHDGKMSGSEALAALEARHGLLPKTLTSITGSGGRHLIFRVPDGDAFGNSLPVIKTWLLATTGKATGGVIDVRGDGGLIVLPPSIHPDGPQYRWEDSGAEIAELPPPWRQTPASRTLDDSERKTRQGKSAPRKSATTQKELDALDIRAQQHLANVDPDAVLGLATLRLLYNGDPKDDDRTHVMGKIILGAAQVRFDPETLYELMLNSPHKEGLRDHGRAWFDDDMLRAHRHLVPHILDDDDLGALRTSSDNLPTRVAFRGRNGQRQTIYGRNVRKVWQAELDAAFKQETTAPMVGGDLLHDATGLSTRTATKALEAIEALGWHHPEDVSAGGRTSAYRYHLTLGEATPTGKAKPMRPKKERPDIDAWLIELLTRRGGSMSSGEVRAFAKGASINVRTLRRHAVTLGVRFIPTPEGTTDWCLDGTLS